MSLDDVKRHFEEKHARRKRVVDIVRTAREAQPSGEFVILPLEDYAHVFDWTAGEDLGASAPATLDFGDPLSCRYKRDSFKLLLGD